MNILVFGGKTADNEEPQMQAYTSLFKSSRQDSMVRFCFLDELLFWIKPGEFVVTDTHNGRKLDDYDLIIFRGKIHSYVQIAYCLSQYLKAKKIKFFNSYELYLSPSKLSQAITMWELDLVFPATLSAENSSLIIENVEKYLSFPVIVKDTFGSHGANNFLVSSKAELESVLCQPDINFILQEYIPNEYDYRILVMGDQELAVRRQASGGSHLHNTSQGASASLMASETLPPETIRQAHHLAEHLHMTMAGVDVMQHTQTGKMFFLEINSQPQLLTGAFLEEKGKLLRQFLGTF